MKVFLSWSGEPSKKLARLLMNWLPSVIQSIEPWTSEEIGKGTRWSDEIARELELSRFGILCVDRQHLLSPWIHFEAGAIAKSVQSASARNRVTPLLLDVEERELRDPLALFQATKLERDDMFRLIQSLNEVQEAPLDILRLTKSFEGWWPELEDDVRDLLNDIYLKAPPSAGDTRSTDEVLDEVVHLVRDQRRAIARLEQRADLNRSPQPPLPGPGPLPIPERADLLLDALERLQLPVDFVDRESEDTFLVSLRESPSADAISTLGRWAARHGYDLTIDEPEGRKRIGVLRKSD